MALICGTKLGPYEILSPLGAGGMGEVYRARDTRLDRDVAVKVLPANLSSDPNLHQRLDREAKAVYTSAVRGPVQACGYGCTHKPFPANNPTSTLLPSLIAITREVSPKLRKYPYSSPSGDSCRLWCNRSSTNSKWGSRASYLSSGRDKRMRLYITFP